VDVIKRGGGVPPAAAEDDLKNVEVTMTQDGDTIRVVAKRTDQRVDIGNTGAAARLRVPEGAILDLRSSNGSISTSGPVSDVRARTSNGPITARGPLGQIDLSTSNGSILVDGGRGLVDVETSNGPSISPPTPWWSAAPATARSASADRWRPGAVKCARAMAASSSPCPPARSSSSTPTRAIPKSAATSR
jgi:hypothetical protein